MKLVPLAALLAAGTAHAQTCTSPGADVAGWWDGDLTGPSVADDLTDQAPLTGAVATAPLLVGDALRFDGVASDVLTAGAPLLDSTQPFAIECWVRFDAGVATTQTIAAEVGVDAGSNEGQFALRRLSDGRFQFLRKTGVGEACELVTTPVSFPAGLPLHLVAMWGQENLNDNGVELWVNGTRYGHTGSSNFDVPIVHEFRVGGTGDGTSPLAGEVDELIVHRRALFDDEVQASFLAGASGHCKDCAPIEPGVVHHWTADATCDGYALDDEGGAALAPVGAPSFRAGMQGLAFDLDVDRWYTAARPLTATTGAFSVECWVRPDTVGGNFGILSEFGTGAPLEGQWALRQLVGGHVQFLRFTGATTCGGGSIPCVETSSTAAGALAAGRWTHLCATFDPVNGAEIFVDGVPGVVTGAVSNVAIVRPAEFQVGAYSGANFFEGAIDEVSLFRRALAPSEIATRHTAGRWGRCATPNELPCHLGDDVDYRVRTLVDGLGDLDAPQKFVEPGDVLTVTLDSPAATFYGSVPVLALSVIPSGTDVPALPGAPGLHLTPDTAVLFNGLRPTPLGFTLLPVGGLSFAYAIPNGLQGFTARFQSVTYFPTRFVANAHDVEFR